MSGQGEFFAVGREQWATACELGLGPAVALLVLACGSGRDNSTTRWSADAVHRYTGISWRRAVGYIEELVNAGLIDRTKAGKRPSYKIGKPDLQQMIWLPNTLVTGAGQEVPPIARLRQGQDIEFLQTFVELYDVQDLSGDGGLPRRLLSTPYKKRTHVCDLGQFKVFGFNEGRVSYCTTVGESPFARFHARKDAEDNWMSWECIGALERMGLLERALYLAESDDHDAELIHALSGDGHAEAAADAALSAVEELPGGFKYEVDNYIHVLPILDHLRKATLVEVFRLTYRPRTTKTAAWYARHVDSCQKFAAMYQSIARGELKAAA